jgi:hypothetical protein
MVPVAATADQNATSTQEAAVTTQLLASGIVEVEKSARMLRDQAMELSSLIGKFTLGDAAPARRERKRVAREPRPSLATVDTGILELF